MKKYRTIITTTNSKEDSKRIKNNILLKNLSPCIQVMTNIESSYHWNGKIISDKEIMIIIKADRRNEQLIISEIKSIHSYDTPEIISIDFNILSDKYEKWFNQNSKID